MHSAMRICVPLLALAGCFPYFSQIEKDKHEAEKLPTHEARTIESGGRHLSYRITGRGPELVVFIHGAPGSWDAWAGFLKRPPEGVRYMSVDRPGYGASDAGRPEPSLERQAALIARAAYDQATGPVLLVGHSLGGPVAARIAMDYPDLCGGIVFVAASVDPELEVLEWYHKAGDVRPVRWILPVDMDTANQEILPLKSELTAMLPFWKTVHVPVTVIQGGQDKLVPPGNADFLKRNLPQAQMVLVPEMDHFVPWARPDLIDAAVNTLIRRISGRML